MLRASIIIPTLDGAGPLRACLEALVPGFPRDVETLVVSDNEALDLAPGLADLARPLALRCLHVPHGGPAYARNRGLEIARGHAVVFTDDDCRPRPGWVEALLARVSTSPPVAAGGRTVNGRPANPYADTAQVVLDLIARHEYLCFGEPRFFPTNNCAYPTDALRALGGFDESFRTAEDRDLLRRWRAAGHSTTFVAEALVDHDANPGLAGFARKFYNYGRGAAHFHATSSGRQLRRFGELPSAAAAPGCTGGAAARAAAWRRAGRASRTVGSGQPRGIRHGDRKAIARRLHRGRSAARDDDRNAPTVVGRQRIMTARVSVVVPTRNRRSSLRRALASVARQTWRDCELVVIDDGSSDDTLAWLTTEAVPTLGARGIETRVFATGASSSDAAGRGAAAARNLGIDHARGELVAFLDDDDRWRPAYLEAQAASLDAEPAAALSFAGHVEIDAVGRESRPDSRPLVEYDTVRVRMMAEAFVHTLSVVVCRRSVLDRIGRFDEELSIVHDWEWYLRLLGAGERFSQVERTLVERSVPGGLVTRHREWFGEERAVLASAFAASAGADVAVARHEALVRVSRSFFFARLALSRGDVSFGLARLADAFATSPGLALAVAARRVARLANGTPRARVGGGEHRHAPEASDTEVTAAP